MSNALDDALKAVSSMAPDNHRYEIGQSLWSVHPHDKHCYVAIAFITTIWCNEWLVEVVLEKDLTGRTYIMRESYFTDQPPKAKPLHPEHYGTIYFTSTGAPLKSIPHFSDERSRAP